MSSEKKHVKKEARQKQRNKVALNVIFGGIRTSFLKTQKGKKMTLLFDVPIHVFWPQNQWQPLAI